MEIVKVKIDHEKLMQVLKEQDKSAAAFSQELGMASGYIATQHKRGDNYPPYIEKLICLLLGKDPGYFTKTQEEDGGADAQEVNILKNVYQKCDILDGKIEELKEILDAVFKKANANTVQLEKIKESVCEIAKTKLDVAIEFLKSELANGRVDGNIVLMDADKEGIKHSDLMKAKKELNIQIEVSGYGKNQKNWWYMKY